MRGARRTWSVRRSAARARQRRRWAFFSSLLKRILLLLQLRGFRSHDLARDQSSAQPAGAGDRGTGLAPLSQEEPRDESPSVHPCAPAVLLSRRSQAPRSGLPKGSRTPRGCQGDSANAGGVGREEAESVGSAARGPPGPGRGICVPKCEVVLEPPSPITPKARIVTANVRGVMPRPSRCANDLRHGA